MVRQQVEDAAWSVCPPTKPQAKAAEAGLTNQPTPARCYKSRSDRGSLKNTEYSTAHHYNHASNPFYSSVILLGQTPDSHSAEDGEKDSAKKWTVKQTSKVTSTYITIFSKPLPFSALCTFQRYVFIINNTVLIFAYVVFDLSMFHLKMLIQNNVAYWNIALTFFFLLLLLH